VAGAASPGPSWTDWTRGRGGAAHLWVMSNQAHKLKQPPPHKLRTEPWHVTSAICSTNISSLTLAINRLSKTCVLSCVGGASREPVGNANLLQSNIQIKSEEGHRKVLHRRTTGCLNATPPSHHNHLYLHASLNCTRVTCRQRTWQFYHRVVWFCVVVWFCKRFLCIPDD